MKFLLAIFVVLAQVAGPWLCCCGVPRLFAQESCCVGKGIASTPEPASCPKCGTDPKSNTTPEGDLHPAQHTPNQCPMGGVAFEAVPVGIAEVSGKLNLEFGSSWEPTTTILEWSDFDPNSASVEEGRCSELPFLTKETRLFTHHVLRC